MVDRMARGFGPRARMDSRLLSRIRAFIRRPFVEEKVGHIKGAWIRNPERPLERFLLRTPGGESQLTNFCAARFASATVSDGARVPIVSIQSIS
jgi:hypothetical protein